MEGVEPDNRTAEVTEPLRMPAEWEPQSTIWLAWPDNRETWPENRVQAQIEFTALVKTLAEVLPVQVMVNQASLPIAQRNLIQPDTVSIGLVDIPTNDAWARDYAPTFVLDAADRIVAIDWDYNAWGGKYPPYDDDQQVARRIAAGMQVARLQPGLCFEGGAIESNGAGLILSTRSCAIDPNRNSQIPEADRLERFEAAFADFLGSSRTVWLPGDGIAGDDTDGHIDQLARFVGPRTLVVASCSPDDPQYTALQANQEALREALAETGDTYELVPLPVPSPLEWFGRRIPASYCNFVIANDVVVVPQFSDPEDERALAIFKERFADRYVIGLPSRNLAVGLGSFHCLTQTVPQGKAGCFDSNEDDP